MIISSDSTLKGLGLAAPVVGKDSEATRHRVVPISLLLFVAGGFVNVAAYRSPEPLLVASLSFFCALALLQLSIRPDRLERKAFVLAFAVCWFWSGVSAIYAHYFKDPGQLYLDASYFFETIVLGDGGSWSLQDLLLTENGGAMVLWRLVYDACALLGFEKGRYVGIALNVALVASTCVIGIKMVKVVFQNDTQRMRRFTNLFACCGLFWLFASIHLRDAAILFSVTLLSLFWLLFLVRPSLPNILKLTVASVFGVLLFGSLRTEFSFVPVAMTLAGAAAMLLAHETFDRRVKGVLILSALVISAVAYWNFSTQTDLLATLEVGRTTYDDLSVEQGHLNSLGNTLIVNQSPAPRLLLGSVYLLVYPVPCWIGLQLESAYNLFKTLHALFMYITTPLFGLSFWRVIQNRRLASGPILFLLFVTFGFLATIAYTSLETRHFGAFLVPFLIVCLVPDITERRDGRAYKLALWSYLALICSVHLAWYFLKFGT